MPGLAGSGEFYDLNRDPGELVNLIDSDLHRRIVDNVRGQVKAVSEGAHDTNDDYMSRMSGDWESLSG